MSGPVYLETASEDLEIGAEPVYIGLHGAQRKTVFNAGSGDLQFSYAGPHNEPLVLRTSERVRLARPAYLWAAHTRVHVTTEEPRK